MDGHNMRLRYRLQARQGMEDKREDVISDVQTVLTSIIGVLEITKDKAIRQLHAVTDAAVMLEKKPELVADMDGILLLAEQTMHDQYNAIALAANTVKEWNDKIQANHAPAKGKGQSVELRTDGPLSPDIVVTQTAPPPEVGDTKPDVEITMQALQGNASE